MAEYKCCWNCYNSCSAACKTKEEADRFFASKRFCIADYPVSNHAENPFKRRYCKQFQPKPAFRMLGGMISKEEAEKLNTMTVVELVEYWRDQNAISEP